MNALESITATQLSQARSARCARVSLDAAGRIDHHDAVRELRGAAQVFVAAGRKEVGLLLLELVERAGGVEARARHVERHVEQQGQVGLQVRMHPVLQRLQLGAVEAAAAALVGEAGVGKAVGKHPVAARHAPARSPARCVRGGWRTSAALRFPGASFRAAAVSRSFSPTRRAARLARRHHRLAVRLEEVRDKTDVGRLAGAVDAFKADELALCCCYFGS